jgi:hypothetical protein
MRPRESVAHEAGDRAERRPLFKEKSMADAPDNSDDHPVRYVITNMAHPEGSLAGLRVLTFPAWGSRYTYATREEAEEQMKLYEPDLRAKILGDRADTLLVLAVQCWPGHFDPKRTVWPGDEEASLG